MTSNVQPKVAIITRTKNRPLCLQRCIHTVLNQRFQDFVHVIVNDGGTAKIVDELVQKNEALYQNRVKVIHNSSSLGMEAASNVGIRNSESSYIVILDDDDTWHPDFLDACVSHLANKRHPNIAGVVTHSSRVIEKIEQKNGHEVITESDREPFNQHLRGISLGELAGDNLFTVNAFVFEREALTKTGFYREDLPVLGDWEFNLRFIFHYDIDVIPSTLSYFHQRVEAPSGDLANSVVAGLNDHHFYRAHIQNELLRQDIRSNHLGLGTIMSINAGLKNLHLKLLPFLEDRRLFILAVRWLRRNMFGRKNH